NVLRHAVGPGALSPTQIVLDGQGRTLRNDATRLAVTRLQEALERDPEVALVQRGASRRFQTFGYEQLIVAGKHEYGDEPAQAFVHRLRGTMIPGARFPGYVRVYAGGGPPQGVDFLTKSYDTFPWLVLAVLVLTYLVMIRAL